MSPYGPQNAMFREWLLSRIMPGGSDAQNVVREALAEECEAEAYMCANLRHEHFRPTWRDLLEVVNLTLEVVRLMLADSAADSTKRQTLETIQTQLETVRQEVIEQIPLLQPKSGGGAEDRPAQPKK